MHNFLLYLRGFQTVSKTPTVSEFVFIPKVVIFFFMNNWVWLSVVLSCYLEYWEGPCVQAFKALLELQLETCPQSTLDDGKR